jgi:hypothetical protein
MEHARPDETSREFLGDEPGFEEWAAEVVRLLEARRETESAPSEDTRRTAPVRPSPDRARPSQA